MGASVTTEQIETLRKEDHAFILFFDNDKAGKEVRTKVHKKCRLFNPIYTVVNYCGCKDPAEIVEKGRLRLALSSIRKMA
jgi:DNA primase